MVDLGMRHGGGPVALAEISQRQKISLSYLEQLFGKLRRRALVDSVSNNPAKAGDKIIRLLVPVADFPAAMRAKLVGMKFEVLFPLVSTN